MRRGRSRRRAACLRNIERLERELFPEWFPSGKIDWLDEPHPAAMFLPGAMWQVDDVTTGIEIMQNAQMASRGLLYSALAQRIEVERAHFYDGGSMGAV